MQSAQLAETQARLDQVEERLARTRIEAPFAGVLVSGDLSQAIGGPVEQGKTLFELAPLDGYRVVLKVDERDIRALAPGQPRHAGWRHRHVEHDRHHRRHAGARSVRRDRL